MIALYFLGLFVLTNAASHDSCNVGDWSEWSECKPAKHCPRVKRPAFSYAMEETREWDNGRTVMQKIMREKAKAWNDIENCKASETCPEYIMKPLSGAYPCDDNGVAGDIPCNNIDQLSFLTFEEMGYTGAIPGALSPRGNDIWGWTDPENGDEYAIMGFNGATAFVRITDPENPVPVGIVETATVASSWRDIKVIGNYAYIVSEARDHGLQVFDLTRLRGRDTVGYFDPDAVNNQFGQAHNIVENVDTNFVYVVGATDSSYPDNCAGGLMAYDVSDPLNPTLAGCFGGDGYVHDAQCVIYHGPDSRYSGNEICFCFNEDSLTLVDVTDKTDMTIIAKTGYINAAYTHQGWLTDNHEVILLDDEQDEYNQNPADQFTKTYVWDVKDLENPTLMSIFESPERSIDHNQYIIGDYTYQSNYESGVRILHIDEATYTLTQVGYFDVLPSRTTANFAGTWSLYPYYASGNIAVSSIDYGLFIVKPNWSGINKIVESKKTYAEQTRSRSVLSSGSGSVCPALQESRQCEAEVFC